jgi:sec-independent protein translocase protein TatC
MSAMKMARQATANPDGRMPLRDHIRELRNRILKAGAGLLVGGILGWIFFNPVWRVLKGPFTRLPAKNCIKSAGQHSCDLVVHGIFDGFYVHLKIALIVGAVLSSPIWLYQIWAFVAPGLYKRERRWTYTFIGAAVPLFFAGGLLAYITLDKGLRFFMNLAPGNTLVLIGVQDYLSYAMAMLLIFGLTFELPLFMVILNLAGVVTHAKIKKHRRMMIFLVFLFAAVATPSQDPFTMLALAVPTVFLFEVAEGLAWIHDRRKARRPDPLAELPDDQISSLDFDDTTPRE